MKNDGTRREHPGGKVFTASQITQEGCLKPLTLSTEHPHLAAMAYGPADGVRFIALHGWLDNAASFTQLAQRLPELCIVAVDLPGHGHSEHRSADAPYHIVDYLADVERIADELGWPRFGLIGHSLGAGIAAMYAGSRPERIERVIAIEGLTPLTAAAVDAPKRFAAYLNARKALSHKKMPLYKTEADALQARHVVSDLPHPSQLEAIVSRGLKPSKGGLTWRADPRLRLPSPQRLTHQQALAVLGCITAPVLCFRASNGLIHKHYGRQYEELGKVLPQLHTVDLEGGHHIHLEQAEAVAREIRAFIAVPS